MFFRRKQRAHERFYLFPGQGGRNYVRKRQRIMRWTILVALAFGALLAAAMWWMSRLNL